MTVIRKQIKKGTTVYQELHVPQKTERKTSYLATVCKTIHPDQQKRMGKAVSFKPGLNYLPIIPKCN